MDATLTEGDSSVAVEQPTASSWDLLRESADPGRTRTEAALQSAFRDELDDPGLVLSPQYIGSDRRRTGLGARLIRATFGTRRSLLRFEVLVVAVAVVATASVLLVGSGGSPSTPASKTTAKPPTAPHGTARARTDAAAPPSARAPGHTLRRPTRAPTKTVPASTTHPSANPPPVASGAAPAVTAAAPPPVAAPATTVPPAPAATTADLTPAQMGAQALALVRYPWQNIPGYSIQFLPIADAPSPGFYGNTTFTWGQAGGTSVLYVYPGETVDRLAGITAFEIGHEVDAAAVEPQGGETQIENILGIHPASWAPNCDCAEQGFLSGWYASAFSNFWSPGVGRLEPDRPRAEWGGAGRRRTLAEPDHLLSAPMPRPCLVRARFGTTRAAVTVEPVGVYPGPVGALADRPS